MIIVPYASTNPAQRMHNVFFFAQNNWGFNFPVAARNDKRLGIYCSEHFTLYSLFNDINSISSNEKNNKTRI